MIVTRLSPPGGVSSHTNSGRLWQQEAQKSANLARIRDNQRRSRQRRKEYMLELEAKNREYEAERIKASVEMQGAALKVVDENKTLKTENQTLKEEIAQLRDVLSSLGVTEVELDRRLSQSGLSSRSSSTSHVIPSPTYAPSHVIPSPTYAPSHGTAGDQLNSMLIPQNQEDKPTQITYMSAPARKQSTGGASDSMTSHPQPLMPPLTERPPSFVTLAGSTSGVLAAYSIASSRPGVSLGLSATEQIPPHITPTHIPPTHLPPIEAGPSSGKAPIPQEMYTINSIYQPYPIVPQQHQWQTAPSPYDQMASSSQNQNPAVSQAMTAAMSASLHTQQGVPENPYAMNEYYGQPPNQGNQPGPS
jgi:hypothetical protein